MRIEARLRSLEQGSCLPVYEVVLKAVKSIIGVSLHLTTADLVNQAHWSDVLDAMLKRYGVNPIDHLLVLHPGSEDEHTPRSVEIVAPVDWRDATTLITRSEGRLTRYELPALPHMASILHQGPPSLVMPAYQALWEPGWNTMPTPSLDHAARFACAGENISTTRSLRFSFPSRKWSEQEAV